ncbi:uncharacterized protein [Temnothorax nylanderi]|uniref:uncharacterized protein isoform X2 n=1 Tax=Temnothorax nylanderi TaxID=102681 RepID=UPI003A8A41B0
MQQIVSLLITTHSCSLGSRANALASIIFSAETSAFKHSNFSTETTELGVFLWAHPLRIRVCGLFNLDNQFTLSVQGFGLGVDE